MPEENLNKASSILKIWESYNYPIFRRLEFACYSLLVADKRFYKKAIERLLSGRGWWIWSSSTQKELYVLLKALTPAIKAETEYTTKLLSVIVNGPPKEMFRENIDAVEWDNIKKRSIYDHLEKLIEYGWKLNQPAKDTLEKIRREYPKWKPIKGEKGEFPTWMESGWGIKPDRDPKAWLDMTASEICDELLEPGYRSEEKFESWSQAIAINPNKGLELIHHLIESKIYEESIWRHTLQAYHENYKKDENLKSIWTFIDDIPDEVTETQPYLLVYSFKTDSKDFYDNPEKFFHLFDKFFRFAIDDNVDLSGDDLISQALNHRLGYLIDALFNYLWSKKPQKDQKIPEDIKDRMNKIISSSTNASALGKILIASRISSFFVIDPDWCKEYVIKFFSWSNPLAVHMWQAYLWSARVNADFLTATKEAWIESYSHFSEFAKTRAEENLCQVLAIVMLDLPDLLTEEQTRELLYNLNQEGLPHVIEYFKRRIMTVEDPATYWNNTIEPIINNYWPKDLHMQDKYTSRELSLLIIETKDSFSKAFRAISGILKPSDDISYISHNLEESELPEKYPETVLSLLNKVVSEKAEWGFDEVRIVLDRVVKSKPDITSDPEYSQLNELLLRKKV